MDDKYVNPEKAIIHLIEECSELTKVLCKVERFGLFSKHPYKEVSNFLLLDAEIKDVETAIENVKKYVARESLKHVTENMEK